MNELLTSIGNLGPALGAVVVIGIVCYFLIQLIKSVLDMFGKHGDALGVVSANMEAHTLMLQKMAEHLAENTKAIERMINSLEKK